MNNYKYNFYVGMYDKDTKKQELSNTEFLNRVRKVMRISNIDNYTIYKGKGHYKHTDGTIVCEPSIIVEVITDNNINLRLHNITFNLKEYLHQESVLVTRQDIEVY